MYAKADWFWTIKRQIINTLAQTTTGTVSMTNSSTSGTFSSTELTTLANYRLLVTGDTNDAGATYIVTTHSSGGTALTLDSLFTGATSTAYSYVASRDTYSLATDTGKVLVVRRYGETLPIKFIGQSAMARLKLNDRTVGKPEAFTVSDFSTTGDPTTARQLTVHPYPDKTYRLEILYKQTLNTELSGATRPLIPDDYVQMLVYGSLARGYPIFLNDTERGAFFQGLFNDILALMVAAQREYATDFPQFVPEDMYRLGARRRQRARGGYTRGSLFDRLPNIP